MVAWPVKITDTQIQEGKQKNRGNGYGINDPEVCILLVKAQGKNSLPSEKGQLPVEPTNFSGDGPWEMRKLSLIFNLDIIHFLFFSHLGIIDHHTHTVLGW